MKNITNIVTLIAVLIGLTWTNTSYAQAATGCEGPPELCAQIADLQAKLVVQKAAAAKDTAAELENEKKSQDRTVKLIAAAGTMAAVLKVLLSLLGSWKDFFKTTKGQAWIRVITLAVGLIAFVLSNIGFGIPWWQALILAGGGPGAIIVHELLKLLPALKGEGPLPSEEETPKV